MTRTPETSDIGFAAEAGSFGEAHRRVLARLLESRIETTPTEKDSISFGRQCSELLSASFVVRDPLGPLALGARHGFHAAGAVARILWMLRGESRVAPLVPYWGDGLYRLSDDRATLAGSNTGARIFGKSLGGGQYASARHRLRSEPTSRRAFISILGAEDALRRGRDIPCTIGVAFQRRETVLYTHVMMRANDAHNLLPYNWLEYSLIAALLADDVKAELGPIAYTASTLHLYERDRETARSHLSTAPLESPLLDVGAKPWSDIPDLISLEASLRDASVSWERRERQGIQTAEAVSGTWSQFALILTHFHALKNAQPTDELWEMISPAWRPFVRLASEEKPLAPSAGQAHGA